MPPSRVAKISPELGNLKIKAALPMNQSFEHGTRRHGVKAQTKLGAIAEGARTQTTRNNYLDRTAIKRLNPGDNVLFYDTSGSSPNQVIYGTVTDKGTIDPAIFTGSAEESKAARTAYAHGEGGNLKYANYTLFGSQTPKFIPLDKPFSKPETSKSGYVHRGLPADSLVLQYNPTSELINFDELPASQQQIILERMNAASNNFNDVPTTGEGLVAFKDKAMTWHPHYLNKNAGEIAQPQWSVDSPGYPSLVQDWVRQHQVNPETTKKSALKKRLDQSLKSRYEPIGTTGDFSPNRLPLNKHGQYDHAKINQLLEERGLKGEDVFSSGWQWVERPVTETITIPISGREKDINAALAMGNDVSQYYTPVVSDGYLTSAMPSRGDLDTVDKVISDVDRQSAYNLNNRNVESIEVYRRPADLPPPSDANIQQQNYNLAFKYKNISDELALNDAYNQQWGEQVPRYFQAFTGGNPIWDDRGFIKDFRNNVAKAVGARNLMPAEDTYSLAPGVVGIRGGQQFDAIGKPVNRQITRLPTYDETPLQAVTRNEFGLATGQAPSQRTPALAAYSQDYRSPDWVEGQSSARLLKASDPRVKTAYAVDAQARSQLPQTPAPIGRGNFNNSPMRTTGVTVDIDNVNKDKPIEGVYEQYLDDKGKPQITPFIPARDLNFRSLALNNALVKVGDQLVPYVGSASEAFGSTELVRDPSILPDSVEALQQLARKQSMLRSSSRVNNQSPTTPEGEAASSGLKANQALMQLKKALESTAALQAVDPAMHVTSQKFDIDVNVRPGAQGNLLYQALADRGLKIKAYANGEYDRLVASGELTPGEQASVSNPHSALQNVVYREYRRGKEIPRELLSKNTGCSRL